MKSWLCTARDSISFSKRFDYDSPYNIITQSNVLSKCLPSWNSGRSHLPRQETQRDGGSIPGLGRSPREGNGNPLQYSSLENFMDRGAWWATVHGDAKSWT